MNTHTAPTITLYHGHKNLNFLSLFTIAGLMPYCIHYKNFKKRVLSESDNKHKERRDSQIDGGKPLLITFDDSYDFLQKRDDIPITYKKRNNKISNY